MNLSLNARRVMKYLLLAILFATTCCNFELSCNTPRAIGEIRNIKYEGYCIVTKINEEEGDLRATPEICSNSQNKRLILCEDGTLRSSDTRLCISDEGMAEPCDQASTT